MAEVRWLFEREAWENKCATVLHGLGFDRVKVTRRIPEHQLAIFLVTSTIEVEARHKSSFVRRIVSGMAAEGFKTDKDMVSLRILNRRIIETTIGILEPPEFALGRLDSDWG